MLRIGNRLSVSNDALQKLCADIRQDAQSLLIGKRPPIAKAHNAVAAHTLLGLLLTSAARPVNDPFHSLDLFSNDGCVTLIDKVSHPLKDARIVIMANSTIVQLKHWIDHLHSLAGRLSKSQPELAARILATASRDLPRPIPFFFLLNENDNQIIRIGEKQIAEMFGRHWTLPSNFQRSSLSTRLRETDCPAEFVDLQLGHAAAGNTPYGAASPYSLLNVKDELQPYLDRYLEATGWQPLPGLSMPRFHRLERARSRAMKLESDVMIGPGQRSLKREIAWKKDSGVVIDLLRSHFPNAFDNEHRIGNPDKFPREISAETYQQLVDTIRSPDPKDTDRVLIRLQLLRRQLARLRRHGIKVALPGRIVTVNPEPTPFTESTLLHAARAESLRQRLILYFEEQGRGKTHPSLETRIAEILVSTPLFTALSWKYALIGLPSALIHATYYWNDQLFVDIDISRKQNGSQGRRWVPEPVCSALVLGLRTGLSCEGQTIDPAVLLVETRHLLERLAVPVPARRNLNSPAIPDTIALLAHLLTWSKSFWRVRLPGPLRCYAEGEVPSVSLPLPSWIRVLAGRPLLASNQQGNLTITRMAETSQEPGARPTRNGLRSDGMDYWLEFEKVLSAKGREAEKRSHERRRLQLASAIRRFSKSYNGRITWAASSVTDWAIHLCLNGTRHAGNLAISTVQTYVRTIGRPLIDLADDLEDFLNLSEIGFTALYCDVVASKPDGMQGYTAARLEEFHHHLMTTHGVSDAHWDEIFPDEGEDHIINAGLITEREYQEAYRLLSDDDYVAPHLRHAATVFLLLAYRFGLRRGEIFRLLRRDIQLWNDQLVVIVNNNIYGQTKTANAIRQIPLIESLCQQEREDLTDWLSKIDLLSGNNFACSLFPDDQDPGQRIHLTRLAARVTEALLAVTGESGVRLHHLRHGYATRLFMSTLPPRSSNSATAHLARRVSPTFDAANIRQRLTGTSDCSRRVTYAASVAMGHASPATSNTHYVHFSDVELSDLCGSLSVLELDDHVLAYLLQRYGSGLRVLRHRLRERSDSSKIGFTGQAILHFGKKSLQSNFDHWLEPPGFIPSLGIPLGGTEERIPSLFDIDRLLSLMRRRGNVDGLEDWLDLDTGWLEIVIREALALEQSSGFCHFEIENALGLSEFQKAVHPADSSPSFRISARLQSLFHSLVPTLSVSIGKVLELGELWESAHHPHSRSLLFSNFRSAKRFVNLMSVLDLREQNFEISRPTNFNPLSWRNDSNDIEQLIVTPRIPNRSEKTSHKRLGRIAVRFCQGNELIRTTCEMNRVLFECTVFSRSISNGPFSTTEPNP